MSENPSPGPLGRDDRSDGPEAAIAGSLTLLPGRIAVLVPDLEQEGVLIPERLIVKRQYFGDPTQRLQRGTVVACGRRRGRIPMPPAGAKVWLKMAQGLTIKPSDIDLPKLGALVPDGYSLKIFGPTGFGHADSWAQEVLCLDADDPIPVPTL